jgi:hypothetical protein
MSDTTSAPAAEPGAAAVIPLPNVTELLGSLDVGHRDDVDL